MSDSEERDSDYDDEEEDSEEEEEQKKEEKVNKKAEEEEGQANRQIHMFEKYLEDSGISMAFQVIFGEIIMKKVDPANVFTYTAMRLRQIGQEVAHLLPANLTENLQSK